MRPATNADRSIREAAIADPSDRGAPRPDANTASLTLASCRVFCQAKLSSEFTTIAFGVTV